PGNIRGQIFTGSANEQVKVEGIVGRQTQYYFPAQTGQAKRVFLNTATKNNHYQRKKNPRQTQFHDPDAGELSPWVDTHKRDNMRPQRKTKAGQAEEVQKYQYAVIDRR